MLSNIELQTGINDNHTYNQKEKKEAEHLSSVLLQRSVALCFRSSHRTALNDNKHVWWALYRIVSFCQMLPHTHGWRNLFQSGGHKYTLKRNY